MTIDNCEIKSVSTHPQVLKDGESKNTTTAHVVGSLTPELARMLCGEDGARALFGKDSYFKAGKVTREPEEGAVSVSFINQVKGEADPFLPSCGVNNFHVNGMTEKVSFHVNCDRGGDLLYAKNIANPAWLGPVEIEPLQGALFPEDATVEATDDGQNEMFKGTPEDMAAAGESEERRTRKKR